MNCNKCGKDIGNEAFCPDCGTPAAQNAASAEAAPTAAANGFDIKKYLPIIGIAAAVLVVLILIISLVGGGGKSKAKSLLKKETKAVLEEDVEAYIETLPEYMIEYYEDSYGKSDYEDYLEDDLSETVEYLEDEYGKDVKVSYSIIESRKMTDDEIDDIEDTIKAIYDQKVDVAKGYYGVMEVTVKGKDKVQSYSTFRVIKVDGEWCVYSGGLN